MLKTILFMSFISTGVWADQIPLPTPAPAPGPSKMVTIFPNYACLNTIKSGAAEAIADTAHECFMADPFRIQVLQCSEHHRNLDVDEQKRLESLATSALSATQEKMIEDASSTIFYTCFN